MEKHTILQLGMPLQGGCQEKLEERYDVVQSSDLLERSGVAEKVEGIIMYMCFPVKAKADRELLDKLPSLRVVSTASTAFNHIDVATCNTRGIPVGYVAPVVAAAAADMAWALLLAAARRIVEGHRIATGVEMPRVEPGWFGKEVNGSTIGIVGMGRIGLAVAQRAIGFDMTVVYHNRRRRDASVEDAVRAEYVGDLKQLMSCSDFIVCCLPASAETTGMFNADVFSAAKRGAVFVNIGRGSAVDHDALVTCLREERLYAAGLDVTLPEPLPRGHPLLGMDNVVIAPHVATATLRTRTRSGELALRNLHAGLEGKPLEVPVVL